MELSTYRGAADAVILRMEVDASDVIATALGLLDRDLTLLRSPAFADDDDTAGMAETLATARRHLMIVLESYYLPPQRSGVPA